MLLWLLATSGRRGLSLHSPVSEGDAAPCSPLTMPPGVRWPGLDPPLRPLMFMPVMQF